MASDKLDLLRAGVLHHNHRVVHAGMQGNHACLQTTGPVSLASAVSSINDGSTS